MPRRRRGGTSSIAKAVWSYHLPSANDLDANTATMADTAKISYELRLSPLISTDADKISRELMNKPRDQLTYVLTIASRRARAPNNISAC